MIQNICGNGMLCVAVVGIIMIAIRIGESILISKWNKSFFLSGIRLYSKSCYFNRGVDIEKAVKKLSAMTFSKTSSVDFKVISDEDILFRVKSTHTDKSVPQLLLGHIRIDFLGGKLTLLGRMRWSSLLFLPVYYYIVKYFIEIKDDDARFFLGLFLFIAVIGYAISYFRHRQLWNKIFATLYEEFGGMDLLKQA